jgi:glycine/D-amino acid oxidase-like deaminating enzyme
MPSTRVKLAPEVAGVEASVYARAAMNQASDIFLDAVIVGGGIAGMWLLNLLAAKGYRVIALEASELGCEQTLASQGMIHGGLKYALSGTLTHASEAIAGMPERWRACLSGQADVDLSGLEPLSEHYYLFAEATTLGKLTTFFASKALRGRINKLDRADFPAALDVPQFNGSVYELQDFVLNTGSLLERLLTPVHHLAFREQLKSPQVERADSGYRLQLGTQTVKTNKLILCAGAGIQALLDGLGIAELKMQLRPLQQMVVRHDFPHPLFGHCLTGVRRAEPRLTITSHSAPDGSWLWYIGGQLASRGAALEQGELIAHTRQELATCIPWIDWNRAEFTALRIDRAEPEQTHGKRPDEAFAVEIDDCLVCWPTKLSLAPDLGDRVLAILPDPCSDTDDPTGLDLPHATVGIAPWERSEQARSAR